MAAKDPKDDETKKTIPARPVPTQNRSNEPAKATPPATPAARPAGQPPAKVPAGPANANGAPANRRSDGGAAPNTRHPNG